MIGWQQRKRSPWGGKRQGGATTLVFCKWSRSFPPFPSQKTMNPLECMEGEPVIPRGRRGLSIPNVRQRCAHTPPPQGRRRRSRDILAMADPKCWSAFRRKVLQVEATFMSISGGEGGKGNGSALGGGRKGSHGSWGQLRRQQGDTSADLLGEDRRFG